MGLQQDVDALVANASLVATWAQGGSTTIVTMGGVAVRSPAKLIADKDAEINVSANGILAQTVTLANAAGISLSQANIAAAQALEAAGTSTQYSTALAAIASQTVIVPAATVTGFNGTVVASCMMDSRLWSDGGVARKQLRHTSWYKEPTTATGTWRGFQSSLANAWAIVGAAVGDYYFDTTTKLFYSLGGTIGSPTRAEVFRGNQAEIPEKMAVSTESGRLVCWDITVTTMPMWRAFTVGTNMVIDTGAITSIASVDGKLLIGQSGQLTILDFIADKATKINAVGVYEFSGQLSQMTSGTWRLISSSALVSATVNSVAAKIFPNAPIDQATGMPVPTIAVFTAGGVSVIKDDGTVVNSASTTSASFGFFDVLNRLQWNTTTALNISPIAPLSAAFTASDSSNKGFSSSAYSSTNTSIVPPIASSAAKITKNAIGSTNGLTHIRAGQGAGNALIAGVTTSQPPIWQVGDSRGCWGGSVVAGTVVDTNVLTPAGIDGAFTSGSGWTLAGSWVIGGGIASHTAGSGDYLTSIPVLTIGKAYTLTITVTGSNCVLPNTTAGINITLAVGTTTVSFTAISTQLIIFSSATSTIDNLLVKECAGDLSIKAAHLSVVGTLTKSHIATGAQLMSWSGFSVANYLQQPSNANWNALGTGDFSIRLDGILWGTSDTLKTLLSIGNGVTAGSVELEHLAANTLRLSIWDSVPTKTTICTSTLTFADADRHTLTVRRSTVNGVANTVELIVDGVVVATAVSALSISNTTGYFRVAEGQAASQPWVGGAFAAISISATPSNSEQSKHIHATISKLYQPNSQCCLAGVSNAVLALSHDESTGLTSVITSTHVTRFKDLVVSSSETISVGTPSSISSGGGYEFIAGSTGSKLYTPSRRLIEELSRTLEQRKAFGSTLVPFEFDAVTSQVAFVAPLGYSVKFVYSAGTLKRLGTGKGYTVSNDGFRDTVTFAVAPGNTVWVSLLCVRSA